MIKKKSCVSILVCNKELSCAAPDSKKTAKKKLPVGESNSDLPRTLLVTSEHTSRYTNRNLLFLKVITVYLCSDRRNYPFSTRKE